MQPTASALTHNVAKFIEFNSKSFASSPCAIIESSPRTTFSNDTSAQL